MVALHILNADERAFMEAERETTVQLRAQYRERLHELLRDGSASHAYIAKLGQQIDACSRHIRRFDVELAR